MLSYCAEPGCPNRVAKGRCPQHQPMGFDTTGSAAKRGYDRRWRRFRKWFLARHPWCSDCRRRGRATLAKQVHHIVKIMDDPSLRLVESNCVPLCRVCHEARTAKGE